MKTIMIGDLHLGVNEQDENFLKYQRKSLEWIIEQVNNPEIDQVILLGDLFHNRKALSLPSLKLAKWFISNIKHKLFGVSIGNHDSHYKNTNSLNSPSFLLDESYIANDIMQSKDSILISWINEANYDNIVSKLTNTKAKYLFGHLELSGFKMIKGINSTHDQINKELLDKFDHVISGHYHCYSQKNNITYIGSPYEMNWGDSGDTKFIATLDHETGELETIPNPLQYHLKLYFETSNVDEKESLEYLHDKSVKLFINCEQTIKMNKLIERMISEIKNLDITDNFMVQSINSDNSVNYNGSVIELWSEYIEDEELENKEDINRIFEEEYKKVVIG